MGVTFVVRDVGPRMTPQRLWGQERLVAKAARERFAVGMSQNVAGVQKVTGKLLPADFASEMKKKAQCTVKSRFKEWPQSAHFDSLNQDFSLNRDFLM